MRLRRHLIGDGVYEIGLEAESENLPADPVLGLHCAANMADKMLAEMDTELAGRT